MIMELHEFEGATKLRAEHEKLKRFNADLERRFLLKVETIDVLEDSIARLLQLLRDLYRDANPTILDDAYTGVRLPPEWNERILKEIQDEKNISL